MEKGIELEWQFDSYMQEIFHMQEVDIKTYSPLALADIGIAMGGLGSDAAIEAADSVIMTDEPSKIVETIKLSKKTMKIVKENIVFAIFIKIAVLVLCAVGIATMWEAVFADVGVSIIAILNSLRMLKVKQIKC